LGTHELAIYLGTQRFPTKEANIKKTTSLFYKTNAKTNPSKSHNSNTTNGQPYHHSQATHHFKTITPIYEK